MSDTPTERCSICGSCHHWAIDNTFLADGPVAARDLAKSFGISQSAWYRHQQNGHISLSVDSPPVEPTAIEWVRATMNLAAGLDAYRIITNPNGIQDIAILAGSDDHGQYIELALLYTEGSVDLHQAESMTRDLNLDLEDDILTPDIIPTHRMSAKLHAPRIFVGRRRVQ